MKKLLMIALFATAGATSASAIGIGLQGGFGTTGGGGALTIAFGDIQKPSWELGITGLSMDNHWFGIGVFADWWILNIALADWAQFYISAGPSLNIAMSKNSDNYSGFKFDVGARVPIGFRFPLFDHLDLYLHLLPNLGLHVNSYTSKASYNGEGRDIKTSNAGLWWGVGGELGIRGWF